jgi:hypothetical protein
MPAESIHRLLPQFWRWTYKMAWEWIPSIGTAAVGIAGIIATYSSGRKQRETLVEVSRGQDDRKLLMEQWNNRRTAFEELLGKLRAGLAVSVRDKITRKAVRTALDQYLTLTPDGELPILSLETLDPAFRRMFKDQMSAAEDKEAFLAEAKVGIRDKLGVAIHGPFDDARDPAALSYTLQELYTDLARVKFVGGNTCCEPRRRRRLLDRTVLPHRARQLGSA